MSLQSIEENLHDVAGIRIVCFFPKDIYKLAEKICSQDDIHLWKRRFIENPKPNGYRSLHLILRFLNSCQCEKMDAGGKLQFRTIAMDFWQALEHKVKYKKTLMILLRKLWKKNGRRAKESILDMRMQEISEYIDSKR